MAAIDKVNWSDYTPFESRVFKTILKIPKGQVLTYGQVAARLGNKNLARAVGKALGKNQHAPIIPCHRVVGRNGIGGYSAPGGIQKKIQLLKKEGYRG